MISFTSISAGCSMANATARAIASAGMAVLRTLSTRFARAFVRDGLRELRLRGARRDDRHANVCVLHPQALGDRAHREFGAAGNGRRREHLMAGNRGDVDEVAVSLALHDREPRGDAVKDALELTSTMRSRSSTLSASSGESGMSPALLTTTSHLAKLLLGELHEDLDILPLSVGRHRHPAERPRRGSVRCRWAVDRAPFAGASSSSAE